MAGDNAMLRAVEELAAAQIRSTGRHACISANRIALAMFESAGFTQIGRRRAATFFLRKRYMRSPFHS